MINDNPVARVRRRSYFPMEGFGYPPLANNIGTGFLNSIWKFGGSSSPLCHQLGTRYLSPGLSAKLNAAMYDLVNTSNAQSLSIFIGETASPRTSAPFSGNTIYREGFVHLLNAPDIPPHRRQLSIGSTLTVLRPRIPRCFTVTARTRRSSAYPDSPSRQNLQHRAQQRTK